MLPIIEYIDYFFRFKRILIIALDTQFICIQLKKIKKKSADKPDLVEKRPKNGYILYRVIKKINGENVTS